MIPVLIAPVLNRYDLLERMLASVDHPVYRLLVIDNGKGDYSVMPDWDIFSGWVTFEPPSAGMGYGGAINFGITQYAEAPWWLWVSNDVVFEPGFLERLVDVMENPEAKVVTGGFTWGAINKAAVDKIGLVDEWSFFPIYFDDNDYHYRTWLAGVEWAEITKGWKHGEGEHKGSLTIHSDPAIKNRNHQTFEANKARYIEKWGGLPGEETYTTPWNEGGSVRTVKPDISGRASRRW